jgi:hypothetical protein
MMKRASCLLGGVLVASLPVLAGCSSIESATAPAQSSAGGSTAIAPQGALNHQIAEVRAATAQYHNLDKALADGFVQGSPCVSSPAGGMGYHYLNPQRVNDPAIRYLEPEVLVYAPNQNGKLKLVAVEYIVPAPIWPGGFQNPPSLFGLNFHAGPPPLIVLHAWIWDHNPNGMFEDWNPTITCPS